MFRGSSVVEQPAVNRLVVGSNPTRGAISSSARSFVRRDLICTPAKDRFCGSDESRKGDNKTKSIRNIRDWIYLK